MIGASGMDHLIESYRTHLRASGYSARTVQHRIRCLVYADARLPCGITLVTRDELQLWMSEQLWKTWTRRTYHQHFAAYFAWLVESDLVDYNPTTTLMRPKTPAAMPYPVTDDELALALERSDEWWRRVIALAAYGGLRAAEIARLRREDVSEVRIRITRGKGGKSASVPTHSEVWSRIEPLPSGPITQPFGDMVDTISSRARRHFDKIGLPDVHLHRFRAWYATSLMRSGADIRVVQNLTRHSSLIALEPYLAIADERRFTAISNLPVIGRQEQSGTSSEDDPPVIDSRVRPSDRSTGRTLDRHRRSARAHHSRIRRP